MRYKWPLLAVSILVTSAVVWYLLPAADLLPIDFNTQVKPIFNKKCISCHGGVKREADFSLLFRQDALAKAESGRLAIIPGDPDNSELIRRIRHHDIEERMPYKKDPLTQEEVDILYRWIQEGAQWGDHWAYTPIEQQIVPSKSAWSRTEVDPFVEKKWVEAGLTASEEAPPAVLARRVALDLIGLPPPEKLRANFINGAMSYEALVDSLLQSPHFGERWTSVWMDLARYADTKGYERDDGRSIWRYRDWLIKAFNSDMRYDAFLTEQLAGDLLPSPTDDQYIATAFHRNTMTNDEGGTENEEFRTAAVLDRVNTTWEALMGTTFACVQCHSHPYDPFRHEEYYRFTAFFNNTRDEDTEADYPLLRHFEKADEDKLKEIVEWVKQENSATAAEHTRLILKTWQPAVNSLLADRFVNSELMDTKWLVFRNHASCRLPNVDLNGKNHLIYRYASFVETGIWNIYLDSVGGPLLKSVNVKRMNDLLNFTELDFEPVEGVHDLYFTYESKNLKTPEANGMIFDWFYFSENLLPTNKPGAVSMKETFWTLLTKEVPTTPVMMENPSGMHRPTHVFERGNWLVKGEQVQPDVPSALTAFPADAPRNRLGLAKWMTSTEHPLVSRTWVNRVWEQIFGAGLAETLEDLGTQGIPPTHRELLDHLSYRFMHGYNWSLKRLLKEIVLSSTYRQDSRLTLEQLQKDPYNKLLARGSRVRLSAEQVRDQALAVSGLLSTKMYGPSVMPYQPDGIWLSPWSGAAWERSEGEDQHRRGLYTYWKRTAPYPSMMTFDGSAREVCTARRIRTNTPLQALVTLNDSVFVEAAAHLATVVEARAEKEDERIRSAFIMALGREPSPQEVTSLLHLFQSLTQSKAVRTREDQTKDGATPHEALTLVVNTIMNLDEFVTRN